MSADRFQKVTADHLRRDAFLYVRQSSLRQVMENTESTKRQYALRERAVSLGWPIERIHVIDSDLGLSGANAQDRDGFQRLVAEVANAHAGIVLGLEVSRLARNNADWHRLIELAALTQTLILDEDGVYDPAHFNDRLLLGLKGAMSEAELHVLKARLQGGILNKARRGELEVPLPIGLTYHPDRTVVLDPDQSIRAAIQLLFDTFRQLQSATATVKRFRREGWLFPRRIRCGTGKGDCTGARWIIAALLRSSTILAMPAPLSMGARDKSIVQGTSTTRSTLSARTGKSSFKTHTPGISIGMNSSAIRSRCDRTWLRGVRLAEAARPAKESACCRGALFAACAVLACGCGISG